MRRLRLVLSLYILMEVLGGHFGLIDGAYAQGAPSDVTALNIYLPLQTPPQPVTSASVSRTGNPGSGTFYYWIVTNSTVGASSPAGPFLAQFAPNSLSGTTFETINWNPVAGASTYDVLRTTKPSPPSGACNCAVATAVAGNSQTDQSNSLNSYTVATFDSSTLVLSLANEPQSAGASHLILRQAGGVVTDLSTGGGSGSIAVNSGLVSNPNFTNAGNINFSAAGSIVTASLVGTLSLNTSGTAAGLSSTLGCSQFPSLSGDATSSLCAITNAKVNGVAYPAGPATNTVPVVTGANTITYEVLPVTAGGTGVNTLTLNGPLIGQAAGSIHAAAVGVAGQVFTSNGAGVDPSFQNATGGGSATLGLAQTRISATELDLGVECTNAAPCNFPFNSVPSAFNSGNAPVKVILSGSAAAGAVRIYVASGAGSQPAAGTVVVAYDAGSANVTTCTNCTAITASAFPNYGEVQIAQCTTTGSPATWPASPCTLLSGAQSGNFVAGGTGISISGANNNSVNLVVPVTVPNGGTGATTLGANGVVLGQGGSAVHVTTAGTAGQVLTSNGAGVDPTFQAAGAGSGSVTTFSAGTLSPLFTTAVANPTTTPALTFSLSNAGGGTVFGNNGAAPGAPAYTIAPVLGIPGTSAGTLGFGGSGSGTATITAQATAGSPTLTLPNTSGTFAVGASAPLALSATTGNLTCTTCATTGTGGALTLDQVGAAVNSWSPANGDNPLTLNFAQTTAGRVSVKFGETTASVSTGTPYLVQIATLIGSTATPLDIQNSLNGSQALSAFKIESTVNTTGSPDIFTILGTMTASGSSTNFIHVKGGASAATDELILDKNGALSINGSLKSTATSQIINISGQSAHLETTASSLPTITAGFGTSPAIQTGGTDNWFRVNVGTGSPGNTGTVTFVKAFTNIPSCTAFNRTSLLGVQPVSTTTTVVLNSWDTSTKAAANYNASDVIDVHCDI